MTASSRARGPGDEPGGGEEVQRDEHEADRRADRAVDAAHEAAAEQHDRRDDQHAPGQIAGDLALVGGGSRGCGSRRGRSSRASRPRLPLVVALDAALVLVVARSTAAASTPNKPNTIRNSGQVPNLLSRKEPRRPKSTGPTTRVSAWLSPSPYPASLVPTGRLRPPGEFPPSPGRVTRPSRACECIRKLPDTPGDVNSERHGDRIFLPMPAHSRLDAAPISRPRSPSSAAARGAPGLELDHLRRDLSPIRRRRPRARRPDPVLRPLARLPRPTGRLRTPGWK